MCSSYHISLYLMWIYLNVVVGSNYTAYPQISDPHSSTVDVSDVHSTTTITRNTMNAKTNTLEVTTSAETSTTNRPTASSYSSSPLRRSSSTTTDGTSKTPVMHFKSSTTPVTPSSTTTPMPSLTVFCQGSMSVDYLGKSMGANGRLYQLNCKGLRPFGKIDENIKTSDNTGISVDQSSTIQVDYNDVTDTSVHLNWTMNTTKVEDINGLKVIYREFGSKELLETTHLHSTARSHTISGLKTRGKFTFCVVPLDTDFSAIYWRHQCVEVTIDGHSGLFSVDRFNEITLYAIGGAALLFVILIILVIICLCKKSRFSHLSESRSLSMSEVFPSISTKKAYSYDSRFNDVAHILSTAPHRDSGMYDATSVHTATGSGSGRVPSPPPPPPLPGTTTIEIPNGTLCVQDGRGTVTSRVINGTLRLKGTDVFKEVENRNQSPVYSQSLKQQNVDNRDENSYANVGDISHGITLENPYPESPYYSTTMELGYNEDTTQV
ncbi:unnamed protein product [Owenia fusiformis]|uniref:Fibronectin type-III domain-containing protein n=1 Tax=Owenia fusiformis TaxID=6347 RepID=A0A8J1YDK6_OWEFU|nr:unnamed protein product [Owenia fusiformis]